MPDDMNKLGKQTVESLASKGSEAFQQARKHFDATAGESADAVREVRNNFQNALDESLEDRPYTTLALALGLGFVLGAIWHK